MTSYIKITKEMSEMIDQMNYSLSEVAVKGESVKHLFNARMLIKQIFENSVSEDDILKRNVEKEDRK